MCSIVLVSLVLRCSGWFQEIRKIHVFCLSFLFEVKSVKYQLLVFDASLVLLVPGVIKFLPVIIDNFSRTEEVHLNCFVWMTLNWLRMYRIRYWMCILFLKVKLLISHDTLFSAIPQDLAALLISRVGHFCNRWNALDTRITSKSMIVWSFSQREASSCSLRMLRVKSLVCVTKFWLRRSSSFSRGTCDDTRTHLLSSQQSVTKKVLMTKSLYTDPWFASQIHELMRCCHTNNAPSMTTTCITTCSMLYQLWRLHVVPVWNQIRQIPHHRCWCPSCNRN